MLLAIDVGNTATKVGFGDDSGELTSMFRFKTSAGSFESELGNALAQFNLKPNKVPKLCALASVVPAINPILGSVLDGLGVRSKHLVASNCPGLDVIYQTPDTLGADRLANAIYLSEEGDWPSISIDFGTATKIDVVGFSDDVLAFLGGAILPGVRMTIESLCTQTAQLPEIEASAPKRAIGRSTKECLESGTILGHAKAVDGLVVAITQELGLNDVDNEGYDGPPIVATGGLAPLMAPLCASISRIENSLTLEGLLIAARRWSEMDDSSPRCAPDA